MTVGIYAIQRIGTHDRYVGQSVNIEKRWTEHKNALRGNVAHSTALQEAWNYFGQDAFEFLILEECAAADLDRLEQAHMREGSSYNHETPFTEPLPIESALGINPNEFDVEVSSPARSIGSDRELKSQLEKLVALLVESEAITESVDEYLMSSDLYDDRLIEHLWDKYVDETSGASGSVIELLRRISTVRS